MAAERVCKHEKGFVLFDPVGSYFPNVFVCPICSFRTNSNGTVTYTAEPVGPSKKVGPLCLPGYVAEGRSYQHKKG